MVEHYECSPSNLNILSVVTCEFDSCLPQRCQVFREIKISWLLPLTLDEDTGQRTRQPWKRTRLQKIALAAR